jgi:hypothetical protein
MDTCGVVSAETILDFEQAGEVVAARYGGGPIVDGRLVGTFVAPTTVRFCYVQIDRGHRIDAGRSTATVERLPDGRLRITERFAWLTRRGRGVNVFEEIGPPGGG